MGTLTREPRTLPQVGGTPFESELIFQSIIESSFDGISIMDERGVVIEWNPGNERLSGIPREEVIGKTFWELESRITGRAGILPTAFKRIRTRVERALRTGKASWLNRPIEMPLRRVDGRMRQVQLLVFPIHMERRLMLGCIVRDITEHIRTERALVESEERYRSLVETTSDWVWAIDEYGIYTYASPKVRDLLGYEPEEMIGRTPFDFMPEEEAARIARIIRPLIEQRAPLSGLENTNLRRNGVSVVLETNAIPVFDSEGEYRGYRGIDRDITKRKMAEESLRAAVEHYRFVSDLISDFAYSYSIRPEGGMDIEWTTGAFGRITGYTPEEVEEQGGWESLAHPDDREIARKRSRALFEGQSVVNELRIVTRRREVRWLLDFARPVWNRTHDRVVRIYGATQDITERKRAELAQRKSEERYRALAQNSPDIIIRIDREYRIRYINNRFPFGGGQDLSQLEGKQLGEAGTPSDVAASIEQAVGTVMDTRRPFTRIIEFEESSGSREHDCRFVPEVTPGDRVVSVLCVCRDISKSARAERELRESETRFRTLATNAPDGIFETDSGGKSIFVNRRVLEITGKNEDELIGFDWPDILHPDDRPEVLIQWARCIASGGEFAREVRIKKPDGETVWGFIRAVGLRDDSGNVTGYIGTVTDVTEHRRVEEELRESERKLTALVNFLPGLAYRFRNDGHWTMEFISGGAFDLTGYAPGDLVGHPRTDIAACIAPEDRNPVWESIQQALAKRLPYTVEYRIRHRSGTLKNVWERGAGVFDGEGKLIALEGLIVDITDRALAEEALRSCEKIYRAITGGGSGDGEKCEHSCGIRVRTQ